MTDQGETMTSPPVVYRTVFWHDNPDETYYFASIDGGDTYVEINRIARQADRDDIAAILAGTRDEETGTTTFPIKVTRRYFGMGGDSWVASDPQEAPA